MSKVDLLAQAADLKERVTADVDSVSGALAYVKGLILDTFGPNGLTAAYVVLAVLVLVVVWRLTKITFATLKYLVVPAIGLAVLGSFVLPYSFVILLPITVTGCSLILLVKG